MGELAGQVTKGGSAVQGATVAIVDSSNWTVVGTTTSASDGSWSVSGVEADSDRYHAFVQYDDSGTYYNADSLPFLSVNPRVSTGTLTLGEPSPTISVGGLIVDDFDDGNITEYGGDTGSYQTQQTTVFDGTHALEHTGTSFNGIASTSGLANYPSQGDTFDSRVNVSSTNSGFYLMKWAQQSDGASPDGYGLFFSSNAAELQVLLIQNGSGTTLGATSWTPPTDQWLRAEVDWQTDGTMACLVEDDAGNQEAALTVTDTTYSSGGVGFRAGVGVFWDEVTLL